MKYKITIVFMTSILITCLGGIIYAQGIQDREVRASTDKGSIFIGDKIRYAITVKSKKDLEIVFPKFPENKIGDFEIKDSGSKTQKDLFGNRTSLDWYDITTYYVGPHIIPKVEVKYREKGSADWTTAPTQPLRVAVASVLPKGEMVKDIKDIKGPIRFYEINWILVLIFFSVIAIVILLVRAYRNRKNRRPSKLPHEIALQELETIRVLLERTGDIKEYYIRISDCVRRYIETAFRLKAPEMTTEEFLNSLKESGALSQEQKNLLKEFLNACDMVKFAKYNPSRNEVQSVFTTAKNFVEETKIIFVKGREPKA